MTDMRLIRARLEDGLLDDEAYAAEAVIKALAAANSRGADIAAQLVAIPSHVAIAMGEGETSVATEAMEHAARLIAELGGHEGGWG